MAFSESVVASSSPASSSVSSESVNEEDIVAMASSNVLPSNMSLEIVFVRTLLGFACFVGSAELPTVSVFVFEDPDSQEVRAPRPNDSANEGMMLVCV